jgi:hypothetical protein
MKAFHILVPSPYFFMKQAYFLLCHLGIIDLENWSVIDTPEDEMIKKKFSARDHPLEGG